MDSCYSYEPKSKTLKIVVPLLREKNKKLFFKIIRKVHDEGGLIWKESKTETLNSYVSYLAKNPDQDISQFFSGILPPDDYSALRMSLFLRAQSKRGFKIDDLKRDISNRFGTRGNNITNLCSAGYFEQFQELYMKVPKAEFYKYYEMVVGERAKALFIHRGMNINDIECEVDTTVEKALKYHMQDFKIHAKGDGNVKLTVKFANSRTGNENYTMKQSFSDPKIPAIEYIIEIKRPIIS